VKLLIIRCTSLNNRDAKGKTARHWVIHRDCVDVVQGLLRIGASVKVKDKQRWTPLHAAIMGDMIDDTKKKQAIVKILLKYGVDPEPKDGEDKVPLQRMPLWRSGGVIRRVFVEAKG
jgi:ankyrin repeat protein